MLYIFDKDDNFKNIITEDTGLIDTWFKDYQNHLIDEPFVFHVDSKSELLPLIVAENQVAFKHTFNALQQDMEMLKLMRIKEIEEVYSNDNDYSIKVTCEPSWLELHDHFIEDRRIDNGNAQTAISRALDGSRWVGQVAGEFGNGSTNFYWIDAVEALFKIAEEWGGTLQDYITLDDKNEIATRIMYLLPRLGRDNGLLIQPDYNAETIERRTLSYPVTAIWGQGASLEIEDEEGNHTGGYTRYITFEDVEWKKSKGDPVNKPKGQKWVGDPQALAKYGYLKDDGTRMHRFGHFSNQDYETPEELLWATWEALQKEKEPEIYHEAVIDEVDKPIFLGDTGTILDRHYGKPIEVQSQITGLEYDILRPTENVNIVLGNYKDMSRDPLENEIDEIKQNQKRPVIVDKGNFRNKKPMKPTNVEAVGGWETIQVTWDYTDEIYVSHYEVYASQNKDFVPDSQFLVYNGKVSAFGHEVKTDEVWYYRVCAVNYHGVKSEFSDEATASTIRIPLDATNFESIVTDTKNRADEAYDNANLATQNAMDAISKAQISFDKAIESLDQSGLALEQADESFQKALENATRVDNIALKIVGSNLISHDPSNWEQGGISYRDGSEINNNNNIRLKDYMELQPNQIYTLTNYTSHGITTIYFYDKDKNFISGFENRQGYGHNTFTTKDNAHFARGVISSIDGTNRTPDMIGERIKVKLEKGDVSSDWTMHDPDYTNIVATQKGIQAEIGNVQGDITTITAIAQGLDFRVTDNENNIANLQITSQGISGELQSVNTRLDELDSDDRNLITHLPQNWEQGFYNVSGNKSASSTSIRLIETYEIKSNEEYTVQSYGNYHGSVILFESDGTFSRRVSFGANDFTIFTPNALEKRFSIYTSTISTSGEPITPDMIGYDIKLKIRMGGVESAWTPNFNDTGELVNSVQEFVHDFNVTAQGLASRISDNEGNINQLAITVDGTQQTISNMQGDISTITNLANVHSLILESMDHNVNTLTQTVDATVSRLENMSGNMITHNAEMWEQGTIYTNGNHGASSERIRLKDIQKIDPDKTYTLTLYNESNMDGLVTFIRLYDKNGDIVQNISNVNDTSTFTTNSDVVGYRIVIGADLSVNTSMLGKELKVQLERGTYSNEWKDHAGDTYTQYSQLQDAINLRVKEGDLLSQINIEADRVLIDTTGRLVLNAQSTLISNAVIKNAHIESLSGEKLISKSVIADKLDVTNLSSITANLGTVRSGRLLSQNNNMDLNLNTGSLRMNNADFSLGGGARIRLTDGSNGMVYTFNNRSSGIVIGKSLGLTYPYIVMGTDMGDTVNSLSEYFSGFIANTTGRIFEGEANRIYGKRLQFVNDTDFSKGITYDFFGTPSIKTWGGDFELGGAGRGFIRGYINNLYSDSNSFNINYAYEGSRLGYRFELTLGGATGGNPSFRPQRGGELYYDLGTSYHVWRHGYINVLHYNTLQQNSLRELKEDIQDFDVSSAIDYVRNTDIKTFYYKEKDDNKERTLYDKKVGIIYDDLDTSCNHLVKASESTVDQSNIMYMIQAVVKDNLNDIDTLKNANQSLVLKIAELEQRINELESVS